MKKRISILLIGLIAATLACMQTVAPTLTNVPTAATSPTAYYIPITETAPATPTLTNTVPTDRCAQEVAPSAENLRIDADPDAQVITWLENGDVVKVISESDLNWWLVESGAHVGYASSLYLKIVDCK